MKKSIQSDTKKDMKAKECECRSIIIDNKRIDKRCFRKDKTSIWMGWRKSKRKKTNIQNYRHTYIKYAYIHIYHMHIIYIQKDIHAYMKKLYTERNTEGHTKRNAEYTYKQKNKNTYLHE